ncbi:MraY family glycosyltransferase [Uliginosibacterium sp. H3]|uniref:MraY family glycosyltransferase n=1 Tax=Uliginosibacterium silvisoli TaxID=3114758 RepID=A0ABU6K7R2_9RHOO|nr:MraY family glycosyltransferase [Uliginosibacterium sp. H3]
MPDVFFLVPLLAFALSAVICLALARLAPRLRLLDLPDERKRHDDAIPVVGGIGILAGLLLAMAAGGQRLPLEALLPTLLLFVIGVADDMRGMRASLKLLAQILAAWWLINLTDAALFSIPAPFAHGQWVLGSLATPVTMLLVVALLNAINMIDGLDGLAGGCMAIAALGAAYAGLVTGHGDLAGIALALFAAVLGFLIWNARLPWQARARMFLGDAGALGVGMLLCWLVFKLSLTPGGIRVPVTVALAPLAVPMIDMLVVAFWRLAERRNPMQADRGHSHHLLLEIGLPAATVVRVIWLASALVTLATFVAWRLGVAEGRLLGVLLLCSAVHMIWFRRSWLALRRRQRAGSH